MRTMITLDERLMAQLKRRAAEQGTSVSKLVEQAVRLLVRTPRVPAESATFELVTFAGKRIKAEPSVLPHDGVPRGAVSTHLSLSLTPGALAIRTDGRMSERA
jgi:hypothetical protein